MKFGFDSPHIGTIFGFLGNCLEELKRGEFWCHCLVWKVLGLFIWWPETCAFFHGFQNGCIKAFSNEMHCAMHSDNGKTIKLAAQFSFQPKDNCLYTKFRLAHHIYSRSSHAPHVLRWCAILVLTFARLNRTSLSGCTTSSGSAQLSNCFVHAKVTGENEQSIAWVAWRVPRIISLPCGSLYLTCM